MTEPTEHPTLEAALTFAALGWHVLPLVTKGKIPAIKGGLLKATLDAGIIGDWWTLHPTHNIGIRTGPESGLVVLDIDPAHGGAESLAALCAEHGPLPLTSIVSTGKMGTHYYFKYPSETIANVAGLRPGIDIRASGGYVVAPPSVTTGLYSWLVEGPLADFPEWLLAILLERKRPTVTASPATDDQQYIEGTRNVALFKLGCAIRRRGVTHDGILALLRVENQKKCSPPVEDTEVEAIADSVMRYAPDEDAVPPGAVSREARDGKLIILDDLSNFFTEPPPVQWIMNGYLAKGDCALIYGPPYSGKSWLTQELAATLPTGRPCFGRFDHPAPLRVLIVDEENPPDEVHRRRRAISKAWDLRENEFGDRLCMTKVSQGFSFRDESYTYALYKLAEKFRPDLIIFDSVTAVSNIEEESKAPQVRAFFHDKLYPLRAICNSCILMVHHTNKAIYAKEQDIADSGLARGSIDFIAAPDSVLFLRPYKEKDQLLLKPVKIRRGKLPASLIVEIVDGANGGSRPMVKGDLNGGHKGGQESPLQDAIISVLSNTHTPSAYPDLLAWVSLHVGRDINDGSFSRALVHLIETDQVLKEFQEAGATGRRSAVYSLTQKTR